MAGNPLYQTRAWKALRKRCLERDNFECQIRLPGCEGRAVSADHITEVHDRGPFFDLNNLQAACRPCNSAKSNTERARSRNRQVREW